MTLVVLAAWGEERRKKHFQSISGTKIFGLGDDGDAQGVALIESQTSGLRGRTSTCRALKTKVPAGSFEVEDPLWN